MALTRSVEIHLEAAGEVWSRVRVQRVRGREVISELFSFDVDVVCEDEHGLPEGALVGEAVTIVFTRDDQEVRRVHGLLTGVRTRHGSAAHPSFELRVEPRAARLRLVETQEVFLDKALPDILRAKLERHGFEDGDFELRLTGSYAARELSVQYGESDLAFVQRLAEHLGVSFFFEHEDGRDKLVFTDQEAGFRAVPEAEEIAFAARGERGAVHTFETRAELTATSYIIQDYNYRTPKVDLSAVSDLPSGNGGGVVEYGPHVKTPAEAEALARIRAEERRGRQTMHAGNSGFIALSAGRRIRLLDLPHAEGPVTMLPFEVLHDATIPVFDEGGEPRYENRFHAVPAGFTYRPQRFTPKPRIQGVVTGIVQPGADGETGGVAQIDSEGRYTVQLHFDTAAPGEAKASHPIRMAQPFAGPSYGMHFPLRRGTEVLVAFANGDPDRPVIVGALYNTASPSPVVASNATKHQLKAPSGAIFEFGSKS